MTIEPPKLGFQMGLDSLDPRCDLLMENEVVKPFKFWPENCSAQHRKLGKPKSTAPTLNMKSS